MKEGPPPPREQGTEPNRRTPWDVVREVPVTTLYGGATAIGLGTSIAEGDGRKIIVFLVAGGLGLPIMGALEWLIGTAAGRERRDSANNRDRSDNLQE